MNDELFDSIKYVFKFITVHSNILVLILIEVVDNVVQYVYFGKNPAIGGCFRVRVTSLIVNITSVAEV